LIRISALLAFSAVFAAGADAQRGTLDPAFEKVPFDQWLSEHSNPNFHWKVRVPRAALSFHQRLLAPIEITLDGADLQNRRANGRLVFLVQITGGNGARYQHHDSIELSKLDENVKAANIQMSQSAFFLPGDYQLAVAIFDLATREHSTIQEQFRITSPSSDFLPEAWRDLPSVEFVDGNLQSPGSWYLPAIQSRLQWAVSVHSAARLNVILNVAPSVAEPGLRPTPSSGLAALLPTLKVLSQTGSPTLSENVKFLDIGRRRSVFSQSDVKELDWPRLKTSLGDANTASIDVHSLAGRHHDAQFFLSEVRSVLRASEKPSVLVVLSTPVDFESGEDLEPISLEALPPCRVIYVRYRAPPKSDRPFGPEFGGRGRGGRMGAPPARSQFPRDVIDRLEATLKPLHPKVFDVETPEEMTKALKEIKSALLAAN